jgi:hypothetical protein
MQRGTAYPFKPSDCKDSIIPPAEFARKTHPFALNGGEKKLELVEQLYLDACGQYSENGGDKRCAREWRSVR